MTLSPRPLAGCEEKDSIAGLLEMADGLPILASIVRIDSAASVHIFDSDLKEEGIEHGKHNSGKQA
jgi:hypothetical protein